MLRSAILLTVLVVSSTIYAQNSYQFSSGKVELSLSGSLGSISNDSEMKSSTTSNITKQTESRTYAQLSFMSAYYVVDGLSIEPEVDLFFFEKNKPAYSFIGNASYTVNIGKQSVFPFFKLGYGVSNSMKMPINIGLLSRISDKMDVPIFNIGTGAKVMLSDEILLRAEINYRLLSYTYTNTFKSPFVSYTNTVNYDYSFLTMMFGISVIL